MAAPPISRYSLIAWQVIAPKRWNVSMLQAEILMAMMAEGQDMVKVIEKTTATWSDVNRPSFKSEVSLSNSGATIELFAEGTVQQLKIYNFVDKGTKPHVILPRNGKVLYWQSSKFMQAKTVPGQLKSRSKWSKKFWGRTPRTTGVFARKVNHPGTKPRRFAETIREKRRGPFDRRMRDAFNRGIERMQSG